MHDNLLRQRSHVRKALTSWLETGADYSDCTPATIRLSNELLKTAVVFVLLQSTSMLISSRLPKLDYKFDVILL